MARLTRRIHGDEHGMAMVLVMAMIFLFLTFGAALVSSSIQGRNASTTNRFKAQSLAGAQAGLNIALYRLNRMGTTTTDLQCIAGANGVTQLAVAVGGWCGPVSSSSAGPQLANGTSYTYYMSNVLANGAKCGLLTAVLNGTTHSRCLVAIGTSHGVTRRLVQLVKGTPTQGGPVSGIMSYGSFNADNLTLNGDLGSNSSITASGSVNGKVMFVPPATAPNACQSPTCTGEAHAPFTPPVPDAAAFTSRALSNQNAAVSWGTGNYKAAGRELSANGSLGSAGGPVELKDGVYNFCEFSFSGPVFLKVPAGANVKIYIDSPFRTGSGCAGGKGNMNLSNDVSWINENADPSSLQITAWGNPLGLGGTPTIQFNNSESAGPGPLTALISAPFSAFSTTDQTSLAGQLIAKSVSASHPLSLTALGAASNGVSQTAWSRARSAGGWAECKPDTSPSPTPDAGCA